MKKIGNLLLTIFISGMCAAAQAADLSVTIDRASVLLGDSVRLTIAVKGDDHPETPQIPQLEGFSQKFSGTRQESFRSYTVVVQGKTVKNEKSGGGYFFDYQLVPKSAGKFTIPSFMIQYKGSEYPTQPFEIEVLDQSEQSDDIFLNIRADKKELYLGEQTEVTFEWYFSKNIQNYSLQIPWLEGLKGFLISDPETDSNRAQYFQINDGQKVIAEKNTEFLKGKQYTVVRFKKILTPIASGVYTLDAPFLKCDVISGYQKKQTHSVFDDFFDSGFGGRFGGARAVTQEFATRGESLTLNVKDLPDSGGTRNFGGAVGSFQFHIQASPTRLKVGEPITLKMMIAGKGNLESVKTPALETGPEFKSYESESKIQKEAKTGIPVKVFERVLVPRKEGEYEIPSVTFEYFDTGTESYRTVTSDPITVTVEPGSASDAVSYSAPKQPAIGNKSKVQDPEILKKDIRFIKHSLQPEHASPVSGPLAGILRLITWILPVLALVWTGYMRYTSRLHQNPAHVRRINARKCFESAVNDAKQMIRSAADREFSEKLLRSIGEYLSDVLNQPPGKTAHELFEDLPALPGCEKYIQNLRTVCDSCEAAVYASVRMDADQRQSLIQTVEESVKAIDRKI